jgi:hypothetical protein
LLDTKQLLTHEIQMTSPSMVVVKYRHGSALLHT